MKPIVPFRSKKRENFVVLYEVLRSTYKSTYPFQTVKQRASHGLTVDEASEMANFSIKETFFFKWCLTASLDALDWQSSIGRAQYLGCAVLGSAVGACCLRAEYFQRVSLPSQHDDRPSAASLPVSPDFGASYSPLPRSRSSDDLLRRSPFTGRVLASPSQPMKAAKRSDPFKKVESHQPDNLEKLPI